MIVRKSWLKERKRQAEERRPKGKPPKVNRVNRVKKLLEIEDKKDVLRKQGIIPWPNGRDCIIRRYK